MRPLLLIDVDGVLCPFDGWLDGGYPGFTFHARWNVYASTDNSRRLEQLGERFDRVWCTGWENDANVAIAPLHGLPQLPVLPVLNGAAHPVHWKLPGIEAYVGDRPYAFIDDQIGDLGVEYARERDKRIPTFWLPIQCSVGLTDDHVNALETFANRVDKLAA